MALSCFSSSLPTGKRGRIVLHDASSLSTYLPSLIVALIVGTGNEGVCGVTSRPWRRRCLLGLGDVIIGQLCPQPPPPPLPPPLAPFPHPVPRFQFLPVILYCSVAIVRLFFFFFFLEVLARTEIVAKRVLNYLPLHRLLAISSWGNPAWLTGRCNPTDS